MSTDTKLFDSSFPMQIGDKEYQASMLTDRDYGDLDNFIKSFYVDIAYRAAENYTPQKRKELVTIALNESINVDWESDVGNSIICSREGMLRVGWQMCLKRHPALTFKEFRDEAYKNIASAIMKIDNTWGMFLPAKEDVGGSSTENNKSDN